MSLRLAYLKSKGFAKEDGSIKHTKATNFCLPMLGLCPRDFGEILLNVHIESDHPPHLCIVVLNKNTYDLDAIASRIRSNPLYISQEEGDNGNEVVYFVGIPEKYYDDYYLVLEGRYSQLSLPYKTKLTSCHGNNVYPHNSPVIIDGQVATTMFEVINPSQKKREVIAKHFDVDISSVNELIAKPNLDYERYRKCSELVEIKQEYEQQDRGDN